MTCDETGRNYDDVGIQVIQDGDGNTIASRSRGSFKPSPVVGEVVLWGNEDVDEDVGWIIGLAKSRLDTHKFTFPTIDGQIVTGEFVGPDGHVIKVEANND